MIIVLFLKGVRLVQIKNKFSEFNLFYKYLTQKHKIPINEEKIKIILQKLVIINKYNNNKIIIIK